MHTKCDLWYIFDPFLEPSWSDQKSFHELPLGPSVFPPAIEANDPMPENISPSHTIFIVEEDDHARRSLTTNLRQVGYRLLVSASVEDAFEWVMGNEYVHADLMMVNLLGKEPEESLSIARRLREHCKYDGNTPVVIMPDKVPANLEGTDERVNDREWICYYEDVDQLKRLLARLLKRSHDPGSGVNVD